MTTRFTICFFLLIVGCKNNSNNSSQDNQRANIEVGNDFIDAFYSFNRDSLQATLSDALTSQPEILYYQKWAECANYKIVNRAQMIKKSDSIVSFPITVKDDLMAALQINFNVTDTFHISIRNKKIQSVQTSSNDLDVYYQAKEWVSKNRPEYVGKACEGIWAGGPTPCECVQGMMKGFAEFIRERKTVNKK